jgi:hypothetical protein
MNKFSTILMRGTEQIQCVYSGYSQHDANIARESAIDTLWRVNEVLRKKSCDINAAKHVTFSVEIINITQLAITEHKNALELQAQEEYNLEEEFYEQ